MPKNKRLFRILPLFRAMPHQLIRHQSTRTCLVLTEPLNLEERTSEDGEPSNPTLWDLMDISTKFLLMVSLVWTLQTLHLTLSGACRNSGWVHKPTWLKIRWCFFTQAKWSNSKMISRPLLQSWRIATGIVLMNALSFWMMWSVRMAALIHANVTKQQLLQFLLLPWLRLNLRLK